MAPQTRYITVQQYMMMHADPARMTLAADRNVSICGQAVERAINIVEGRKARPVDAREAARGRWDYAQVKDWGSGRPEDLEQMQVTSFSAGRQATSSHAQPFYEQLARHLAELEASASARFTCRTSCLLIPLAPRFSAILTSA
jgi:hypothetical protein